MRNPQDLLTQLANLNPPLTEFNTQRIQRGLALFGNPQDKYQVIHIAGTNGKGSTAAFLEAMLVSAGFKVGKFSSPYLHRLNECICVNQIQISDQELASLYAFSQPQLIAAGIELSSFEMLTLLMLVYSAQQQIDYLVLETGMGGTYDATNVVNSCFSIITNIGLEHTQWLGNSLSEIAEHKAGIIRQGMTILGSNQAELLAAVTKRTTNFISIADYYQTKVQLNPDTFTTQLQFKAHHEPNWQAVELNLFGQFQAANFLCAYTVARMLKLGQSLIFAAAAKVTWPGRLQRLAQHPLIIADAAHNPAGSAALAASITPWFAAHHSIIICSILADKDQLQMLRNYRQISPNIIVCSCTNRQRATPPAQLAKLARSLFDTVYIADEPLAALELARSLGYMRILITGSTYLLSAILPDTASTS